MVLSDRILTTIENRYLNCKGIKQMGALLSDILIVPHNEVMQELNELVDNGEIVEVSKGKFVTAKMAGLIKCKILGSKKDFAFCEPCDGSGEDIFIAPRHLLDAFNNDIVLVKIVSTKGGKSREGKVVKIIKRQSEQLVGTYHTFRSYGIVYPDDIKFNKNIFIYREDTLNAKEGDKVVIKITDYRKGNENPIGKIIEVIGDINEKGNDILSIIRNYKLYEKFPEEVEAYAQTVPETVTDKAKNGREDLTNLNIFTIDGEDTRDIDDAISLSRNPDGTFKLGVHIADVSNYVTQDSILDKEAYNRATSVYFPDRVLPMLPKQLSNGICSLNEGVERLALSVFMDIDGAVVKNYRIFESVIKSTHRMTYTDVQKILDGDKATREKYSDISSVLDDMWKLAETLENDREKRGALDFDLPETTVELDENGKTVGIHAKERKPAHRLIESLMVVCNETVAKDMYIKKAPFVYRVHEKPAVDKMTAFLTFVNSLGVDVELDVRNVTPKKLQEVMKQVEELPYKSVINTVMLRSLKKARYLPQCLGHFGLASDFYCHFTSPIRRYPDLVIHRIIKAFLHNKARLDFLENFVAKASLQSSEREKLADEAERAVDDLKKAEFMSHHIGEQFIGIISGVSNKGLFVELENTCEGFINITSLPQDFYVCDDVLYELNGKNHKFKLGQSLNVEVLRVNLFERKVDFAYKGVAAKK